MRISRSAAQAKSFDQGAIAAGAFLAEIRQQAPALSDHHQEATARVEVVLMDFEVFRKLLDAPGEHGDLHFRRSGIGFMNAGLFDECRLFFSR